MLAALATDVLLAMVVRFDQAGMLQCAFGLREINSSHSIMTVSV